MTIKLFTHNADIDGMGCAWLFSTYYGKNYVDIDYVDYNNVNKVITEFLANNTIHYDKIFITDISVSEEVGIKIVSFKRYASNIPAWYDRIDGIMHTSETIYLIEDYDGTPFNKEPNKHEEMVWIDLKEVFENPQKFTYVTYLIVSYFENKED